jgi:selenophosphate synthase
VGPALTPSVSTPLARWTIPAEEIRAELAQGTLSREIVCLGCAAKVELVSTVYPVLEALREMLHTRSRIRLQPRDDVYQFETDGPIAVDRGVYSVAKLAEGDGEIGRVAADVTRCAPDGLVMLACFAQLPGQEDLRRAFMAFYEGAIRSGRAFTVGKGHTIQIAKTPQQAYIVADYVRASGRARIGVANNDTISTIDPNLPHSSWISVFVALNNALNDLFLSGVSRDLRVIPTYDVRDPADAPRIQDALRRYAERFRGMGLAIEDRGPLGFGTKAVGATVVGTTDREIPVNQRLLPGQVLIATRPVGDLAPLTDYLIRQAVEEETGSLEALRLHVLQQMLIPNVEAARLIERHLPFKGEPFDPARHITAARDMTGPGMLAVEELAQDSAAEVYVDDIVLHDERVADVEMPNPTSGTNGAIILAAMPDLAGRLLDELKALGHAPWVIGRVEGRADPGRILLNENLRRLRFLTGIEKGLFERSAFTAPRKVL